MKKAILIVLDGFGIGKHSPTNAIQNAEMPFYKRLLQDYPHAKLLTHGEAVGLPPGVMGNSEVGHMTLGAGRVIYQDLVRINRMIEDQSFFTNPRLLQALAVAKSEKRRVHLIGLVSDGGVHSHLNHLKALLTFFLEDGATCPISVHLISDGRDTPPDSGRGFIADLLSHEAFRKNARVATLMGRYWAMDRDKRQERTERAERAIRGLEPAPSEEEAIESIEAAYQAKKTDEFLEPVIFDSKICVQKDDVLIFFNFRSDRMRQLVGALAKHSKNIFTMTQYDPTFSFPVIAPTQNSTLTLGQFLETRGLQQFRIAETEKYAHVTFFFNGGREAPFKGEDRFLVPSPKEVATYDLKPEMSALAVTEEVLKRISTGKYDFILMNFANGDMVGHTGIYEATLQAMKTLDTCLSQIIPHALSKGYDVLITADHGNAEEMVDACGRPHTQHTLNPVPLIWVNHEKSLTSSKIRNSLRDGTLADVAPTLYTVMGLPIPETCTGRSLIKNA